MKIAFVHDWFKANGGAEKLAGSILDLYRDDDITIFTLFDFFSDDARKEILGDFKIEVSFMQYLPSVSKYYRFLLPVMPFLMRRFNVVNFDLIISSSHAVAKGIRSNPHIPHICYCHTPMRYVWDMYDDYAAQHKMGMSFFYRKFIEQIRKWDLKTAKNVHYFIANSEHVKNRIADSYKRDSKVIYPPVRVDKFVLYDGARQDYYLCLGRFVPYKKIDLVIKAFRKMPEKKLILIGEGYGTKQFAQLLDNAPNIQWLGYKKDAEMLDYMQKARACIFAAKEDFGIMCVEAQACGTPVIALNYGGYRETVIDGVTGYLFENQTEESIIQAVKRLEESPLRDSARIRENSLRFSEERFRSELSAYVADCMVDFEKNRKVGKNRDY